MKTKRFMKVLAGVGCLAAVALVLSFSCAGEDMGSAAPVSESVAGIVVTTQNVDVNILFAGVSIFGAGGPIAVPVPANQLYNKTVTGVAPYRVQDIYSAVWNNGVAPPNRTYVWMKMLTTDALGESQHSVSFYFSAWRDNNSNGAWDANDTAVALPVIDFNAAAGNLVVQIGRVAFQDNAANPLLHITQVISAVWAVDPNENFGRPYVLYAREAGAAGVAGGGFYRLNGVVAHIPDPATVAPQDVAGTIPDRYSVQVPGDYFFIAPPTGGLGVDYNNNMYIATNGDNLGEFDYTVLNAAFSTDVLVDPANIAAVGDESNAFNAATIIKAGSGLVHELAVTCTFLTLP